MPQKINVMGIRAAVTNATLGSPLNDDVVPLGVPKMN